MDFIDLDRETFLEYANYTLLIFLADSNLENLQLKSSLYKKEKELILEKIKELRNEIQKEKNIDINNYELDLSNSRLILKK